LIGNYSLLYEGYCSEPKYDSPVKQVMNWSQTRNLKCKCCLQRSDRLCMKLRHPKWIGGSVKGQVKACSISSLKTNFQNVVSNFSLPLICFLTH